MLLTLTALTALTACEPEPAPIGGLPARTLQDTDGPPPSCADDDAIELTAGVDAHTRYADQGFDRVIVLAAPNELPIRIYAQDQVTDAQMMRAMGLLRHFLNDAPDTTWGHDKTDVANTMGDRGAVLMMPNGADGDTRLPASLRGQPLYADETPVEGDAWYLNDNYRHRDAAFEEIFHLVHDAGIGTNHPGARPEYQADLEAEAEAAIADGRWGMGAEDWLAELRREGSLAQEYIASVLDSSMGLWAAWDQDEGGMWGIYVAKDRAQVQELDPAGWTLLTAFLAPQVSSEMRVDPGFEGTFVLQLDPELSYTHKSQYLQHVTLTGDADASLVGNDWDNTLRGNEGDNALDGGEGSDTVVYCATLDELVVSEQDDGTWRVEGPMGTDTLVSIEALWLLDGVLEL
jgi:hypothetical protein